MTYYKRMLLIAIMLFSCVGCDQITKVTAQRYLASSGAISYWGDIVRLQYAENSGAFLSLGAVLPAGLRFWLLIVLTGIGVAGMLAFILVKRNPRPSLVIAISFIMAGGVGNLIDRIVNNGAVIDFMDIGVGSLRTGIFNIADVAIMIGMGMLIVFGHLKSRSIRRFYALFVVL
jgi:signal peptidase II